MPGDFIIRKIQNIEMWKHMKTDCTDPASLKLSTRRPNPHAVLPVRWLLVAASKMSSAYFMFHIHYSLRANGRLLIVMEDLPVILNVKDGFHHDLNANVNVELRAPTLPCIIWDCEFYYQHFLILKKSSKWFTFSKKFLLDCQDAAICREESDRLFDVLESSTLQYKTKIKAMLPYRKH